ncbi:hypothetical protein F5884DRAFT_855203 [Xylogone sp. PMI_703]|nr:hypothetical protein F5884DRAFT_855203 [Xylogone sp. PMI_703]
MVSSEDSPPSGKISRSKARINQPQIWPAVQKHNQNVVVRNGNCGAHIELNKARQQNIPNTQQNWKPTPPAELIQIKEDMEERRRVSLETKIKAAIRNYPPRHCDEDEDSMKTKRDLVPRWTRHRRLSRHENKDTDESVQECPNIIDYLKQNDGKDLQALMDIIKKELSISPVDPASETVPQRSVKDDTVKTDTNPHLRSIFNPNAPEFYSHRVIAAPQDSPVYAMPQIEMPRIEVPPEMYSTCLFQHQPLQQKIYTAQICSNTESYYPASHQAQYGNTPVWNGGQPYTASDDGPGLAMHALQPAVAEYVMASFKKKYPLTGNLKAAPKLDGRKRHASTIQQRVEFLLWRVKEGKAQKPPNA